MLCGFAGADLATAGFAAGLGGNFLAAGGALAVAGLPGGGLIAPAGFFAGVGCFGGMLRLDFSGAGGESLVLLCRPWLCGLFS